MHKPRVDFQFAHKLCSLYKELDTLKATG